MTVNIDALKLFQHKKFDEAEKILADCREPENLFLRGVSLEKLGRPDMALNVMEAACKSAMDTGNKETLYNCAVFYQDRKMFANAVKLYQNVLQIDPLHTGSCVNLSRIYFNGHQYNLAEKICREFLKHKEDMGIYANLGSALIKSFKVKEAVDVFEKALACDKYSFESRSRMLATLNYLSDISQADLFRKHREWDRLARKKYSFTEEKLTGRGSDKIRIGYVSPDFRCHSVAFFFEPLLRAHDRTKFEIDCFHDSPANDIVTGRIKALSTRWHDISRMNPDSIYDYIKSCKVDILVDLASYTGRLMSVFARRAAPIQISYLGYATTSGLRNMDYRLVDDITDPPGAERFCSEKLLRISGGMWAYAPSEDASEVSPMPCEKNGFFTFGSFNNTSKMSNPVFEAWSTILKECPTSKLMLKNSTFSDDYGRNILYDKFAEYGIGRERLILKGHTVNIEEHYKMYNEVDLGLDPFPYNGVTTTFEAMWMGVPVLTIAGDRHAARSGESIMQRFNLGSFVAVDTDSYINLAVSSAENPGLLRQLRPLLRNVMAQSPLLDAKRLALEVEKHYIECYNKKN